MSTATERIPVLVTGAQKAKIAKMAKASGLTMGEFLRRAAESYVPNNDDKLIEALANQVIKSTDAAAEAIDSALSFIAASDKRIEKIDVKRRGT
jgi:hypothetical protein